MANREICKYCRNLVLFGEEIPDEQAEEHAIMMCDCQGARIHQRARERQEKAKDNIKLAINETDEEVCEYLKQCVELVDRRNKDTGAGSSQTGTGTGGTYRETAGTARGIKYNGGTGEKSSKY